jgi:prepilin-type N-terminal cleavage/methylation domain-containing protein
MDMGIANCKLRTERETVNQAQPLQICSLKCSIFNLRSSRSGFTLVEMLTVIVIIGILVGLIAAAVVPARTYVKNSRMKKEISDLATAIETCKAELGLSDFPADFSNADDLKRCLAKAFPRCDAASLATQANAVAKNPGQALVFWLGGMKDANGNYIGFSRDQRNPFDTTSTSRIGPFFAFDKARLSSDGYYYPQNDKPAAMDSTATPNAPYVYFKPVGGDYTNCTFTGTGTTSTTVRAYRDTGSLDNSGNPGWANKDSYQILCPGLDGKYGTGNSYPTGKVKGVATAYSKENFDDITNFTKGVKIESDM